MTKAFMQMLNLMVSSVRGNAIQIKELKILPEIFELSEEQNVAPLIIDAVKKNVLDNELDESDIIKEAEGKYLSLCLRNIQNHYFIYSVFEQFKNDGIRFLMLKGDAFSVLYSSPELRVSSDTDILVLPEDEEKVWRILQQHGYEIKPRSELSNESSAKHRYYFPIDIHIALYDEIRTDLFFDNVESTKCLFKKTEYVDMPEYGKFETLNVDDGLLFYFFHLVKHFLSEGMGIRMVMDLLLYIEKYKESIDWDRFYKKVQYKQFFDTIIGIGIEYLGFSAQSLPFVEYSMTLVNDVLDDIEAGGIFGFGNEKRMGMKHIVAKKKYEKKNDKDFDVYAKDKYKVSLIRLIFPRYSDMCNKYPVLKQKKHLYLFFWIKRLVGFGYKFVTGKVRIKNYTKTYDIEDNEVLRERIKLAEELKML